MREYLPHICCFLFINKSIFAHFLETNGFKQL